MKTCPHCTESVQDDATTCDACGRSLVEAAGPDRLAAPSLGPEKMAEIRRLQRIASGRPTRADSARKAKGILYLAIIGAILVYTWSWKRSHQAQIIGSPAESIISFEVFNAAFGPKSPMDPDLKKRELERYLGKRVVWTGTAVYVNQGSESAAYMNVRHLTNSPLQDAVVYFSKKRRDQLREVRSGQWVRYAARIHAYDDKNGCVVLKDGDLLEATPPKGP